MCLIALAIDVRPDLPLVVIANRDESLARPTEPLHAWDEGIVAGRDLEAGGTWMGVHPASGRIAMVTNVRDVRDMRPSVPGERSRGALVRDFLIGETTAEAYVEAARRDEAMRGFNLVAIDGTGAFWSSNRGGVTTRLGSGIHGVSNALLDTPWPKVVRAKAMLAEAVADGAPDIEALMSILADEHRAPDAELPATGVGLALERVLSPIRIAAPGYGTRCSTVLIVQPGLVRMVERAVAPSAGEVHRSAPWPVEWPAQRL